MKMGKILLPFDKISVVFVHKMSLMMLGKRMIQGHMINFDYHDVILLEQGESKTKE